MPESASEQPSDLKGAAVRTFSRIAESWSLGESQQRQMLALSQLPQSWDDTENLVDDLVLMRIGHIISIYRALHTIFRNPEQANSWIHRDNAADVFCGAPAIKLMCNGHIEDLEAVRCYLEAQLQ
ncbi:hypothetical protein GTY70_05960 [Stenotrophomonas maltophilia]|uniref:antitoxin Xre/MbcA/ParS toxin-binding domain-containing protein n=1 Tax=Stenotrophomonas pavanii TaxID=487698 RepID=UPI001F23A101|nr:antitoxin Xre/MbcA/ParS toxin-binding domain-containing protein [Stenotrophomonas pavanii]MCF3463426.1 hypothetical protein [Stenotrophomonas maltophilia]MCF3507943.1 hypothetical protein [Stenotrophomonas maltophilia]MCU1155820.1 hypothetical protein [Stenotrophomonas maltophilia]MCU1167011.1 hypothetical protein [Stenotrophomonas maltophilia]MCU1213301.1 hypothetical protein [Stenotrophomonas maltophilia]